MNYKNINDYEQLYLIKENDEDAKDIVFKKYRPIVLSVANKYYKFLKDKKVDLDDLIQEGQIGLFNAINAFKDTEGACFYTFSTICIEREIRSYCRQYSSPKNNILNDAYSVDQYDDGELNIFLNKAVDKSIFNPDKYLSHNSIYNKLINFKNSLTVKQGMVFELRYNGFKYKEISELLDISINSVDHYIHKYKEKLMQNLFSEFY